MIQTIGEKVAGHAPQLIKFLVTGGLATATHVSLFYVFKEYLGWHYLIATTVGFCIAFVVSFTLQKFWTFQDRDVSKTHSQGVQFFALQLANLCVNALALFVLVSIAGFPEMLSQIIVLGLLAISTFFISKTFIFAQKTTDSSWSE